MAEAVLTEADLIASNPLTQCCLRVQSPYEPRIMSCIAEMVHMKDADFQDYKIPAIKILGKDYTEHDTQELLRAVKHLAGYVVTIHEQDGKDEGNGTMHTPFIASRYIPEKGVIELQFFPALKSYYMNLKKLFEVHSVSELIDPPSVYSQRLYEVLKPWSGQPEIEIALSDMHRYLDTSEQCQQDFKTFRRTILWPAHKELVLREGSTLRYQIEPVRQAKKVVALRILFKKPFAALPLRARVGKMPADPSEKDMQRFCHDCYESYPEKCSNFYKTPSEMRGPKKALCTFCITAGRVSVAREIDEWLPKTSQTAK